MDSNSDMRTQNDATISSSDRKPGLYFLATMFVLPVCSHPLRRRMGTKLPP